MPESSRSVVFVNFDGNSGAHDGRTRQQVRSEAARFSHRSGVRKPKASKKKAAAVAGAQGTADESASSGASKSLSSTPTPALTESGPTLDSALENRKHDFSQPEDDSEAMASVMASSSRHAETDGREENDGKHMEETNVQRLGLVVQKQPDPTNPFDAYPVPMQPFYPRLVAYLWPFMLRGWIVLNTSEEERQTALNWVQRETMSSPSYFYMNMLTAASELAQRSKIDIRVAWWLKAQTVAALNDSLRNPARELSLGVLLAVGRIAMHEIVLGNREVGQTVHRPAQARMIRMKGGVDALDMPVLVRRHVMWAERLMRHVTGVAMLSSSIQPERSATDDIKVLDAYMPERNELFKWSL